MNVSLWTTHALEKLSPHTDPPPRGAQAIRLKAAGNECEDAQIALRPAQGTTIRRAGFSCSDLSGPSGATIGSREIAAFWQWYIYVLRHPPWSKDPASWLGNAPGFFPDAFLEEEAIRIPAEWTQGLWVRIHVPQDTPPGTYRGSVTISLIDDEGDSEERSIPLELTVWPFSLPARPSFRHTEWFYPEVLARYYRVEPWSEAHWNWIRKVAADMAFHRQDMILTDFQALVRVMEQGAGHFSFDFSRLDRWLDLFHRAGIEWIEGGHLAARKGGWTSPFTWQRFLIFNQEGQALEGYDQEAISDRRYDAVMEEILRAIYAHIKERWGIERYVQHLADEPVVENKDSWLQLCQKVKSWIPGVRIIEAAMCKEIAGAMDIRVPQIQEIEAGAEARPGEELWSYVCLAPQGHHPNRFLDMASIRNRIIFWLSFSLGLKGFLHWGYNSWKSWSRLPESIDISPWMDATAGSIYSHDIQPLPAGDPHIVYPGRQSICSSLRWEVVRKGLEDYELLRMLEERARGENTPAGRKALGLIDRIRNELAHDSLVYTRNDELLLAVREQAGELLSELIKDSA